MKYFLSLSLSLILSNLILSQELDLKIELEKTEYLTQENILCYIEVKNNNITDYYIPEELFRGSRNLNFEVVDGSGNILHPYWEGYAFKSTPQKEKLIVLKPGESIGLIKNLLDLYANEFIKEDIVFGSYLRPDKYTIQLEMKCKNGDDIVNRYQSNRIKFLVHKAINNNDIQYVNNYLNLINNISKNTFLDEFETIVSNSKDSNYYTSLAARYLHYVEETFA